LENSYDKFPLRVLAVIVLYKMQPSESPAFQTLRAAILRSHDEQVEFKILLYDNTPRGQKVSALPADVQYEVDVKNGGVAKAYNYALEFAQREGYDWLLTLDQDTQLPIDFASNLYHAVTFVAPMNSVAAIAPLVFDKASLISPNVLTFTTFPKMVSAEYVGISLEKSITAVNSASTFRVDALKSVGGYDRRYWLDYSDAFMYMRLQANNLRVFIAGNIRVQHNLSVVDTQKNVSPERYEQILGAESAFWDECMGRAAYLPLLIRLLYRAFVKFKGRSGYSYRKIALRFLCQRLFYSRKHRMKIWEQSVRCHLN
jgi:GT2 family glycosyltransferase